MTAKLVFKRGLGAFADVKPHAVDIFDFVRVRSDIHPIAGVELNVFAVIDRGVDEGDRARCVLLHHELAFVRGFNHRVVNRGLTLSDFMLGKLLNGECSPAAC